MDAYELKLAGDNELLSRIAHDNKALRILFDRYWTKLYSFAYNVLKEQAVCEDIVQEVFVSLWEKQAAHAIAIDDLGAYLTQAIKYKIFNHIRSKGVRDAYWQRFQEIKASNHVIEQINLVETKERLMRSMGKLSPKCQEIFRLSRFDELSNKEIATKLGLSTQTVKNQISKALTILRQEMPLGFLVILDTLLLKNLF